MALRLWVAAAATIVVGGSCASSGTGTGTGTGPGTDGSSARRGPAPPHSETAARPDRAANLPRISLAGARCRGAGESCSCRGGADPAESEPPAPGTKRFEIRVAADGGEASLESGTLGRFAGKGGRDSCYYVDLVGGSTHSFSFVGQAADVDRGFGPRFMLREYGATGPFWYDIVSAACDNGTGRCDRKGAEAWGESLKTRKRGRLEPCGSAVITGLNWETSGGQHERDGGNFRDLTVSFTMEVKKFATQFAPGSTECIPK